MAKKNPVIIHFKKHGIKYLQGGLIVGYIILVDPSVALGVATIEQTSTQFYKKVLGLGRAVILIKGGLEIVQYALSGDFQQVKKTILNYLGMYALLLLLPYGLDQIDALIGGLK
jgi:hypothetical protein